jgi:hypothetical protein
MASFSSESAVCSDVRIEGSTRRHRATAAMVRLPYRPAKHTVASGEPAHFGANSCWASEKSEPEIPLVSEDGDKQPAVFKCKAPLPKTQSSRYVGADAAVSFEASRWD